MKAKSRDMFEQNNYIKWFYDPELGKDWKGFIKKYHYLFWINSMNMKDVEQWAKYVGDKKPYVEHEPLYPSDEGEFAKVENLRKEAYLYMFRSFVEPTAELSWKVQKGEYLDRVLEIFDQLFQDENIDEGAKLLKGMSQVFAEVKPRKFQKELEAERFTIFEDNLLPYLSAYESVYRSEKQIMGELTQEVKDSYHQTGYTVSRLRGNIPPDEAKIEIEFMLRLIDMEIGAWKAGDKEKAAQYLKFQKDFLHHHLIQWIPYLCQDISSKDFKIGIAQKFRGEVRDVESYKKEVVEMDFYRGAALLLKTLLEHDFNQVKAQEETLEDFSPEKLSQAFQGYTNVDWEGENYILVTLESERKMGYPPSATG